MKNSIAIIFLAGALSFAFPQSVNLTGTVRDSASLRGIAGAVVALKGLPLSTTTDSSGGYALKGSGVGPFVHGGVSPAERPVAKRGSVFFGISVAGQPVRIDVCDLLGRTIAPAVERKLECGNYRFNPFGKRTSAGLLCFVKLRIGSADFVFKMLDGNTDHGYGLSRIAGNGLSGALSKSAALAIDTIIVTATGYTVARKPISSYVGANDFLLASSSGNAGIISFDNGSYQSCIVPLVITVVDSSLAGQFAYVKVRSGTDAAGITVGLAKVTGAAGTFSDSVWFSITHSDSAKRLLRVGDGDVVSACYTESSPARVDSVSTTWTGVAGIVQPGGSPILGVVRPLSIHVWDSDVTDSTVLVRVASVRDKTGFQVALHAVEGSAGDFMGHIWFSLKASVHDSVLAVTGSAADTITIVYHDMTPAQDIAPPACIWLPVLATMFLDSAAYHGTGSAMTINMSDDDIADSTAVVGIASRKDPVGIKDTLRVTGGTIRNFIATVGFTTGTSRPGFISVQDGDSVVVSYQDDSPVQTVTQSASWNSK